MGGDRLQRMRIPCRSENLLRERYTKLLKEVCKTGNRFDEFAKKLTALDAAEARRATAV
jgi:hypothetical protein